MRLLVKFTGGTIGSTINEGYIAPDCSKAHRLIELYNKTHTNNIIFDVAEPFTLLSENSTGESITMLINEANKHITAGYDGIIITHGTDTIQYSAAALGYSFPDINIPILLVSANHVLEDPESNGLSNFSSAVSFIEQGLGNGVYVPYENKDCKNNKTVYIHKGTRLLPHLPYSDNLYSVDNQFYGSFDGEGNFIKNELFTSSVSDNAYVLSAPGSWGADVLRLFPYPGMQYPSLSSFTKPPKAVLLDTYHSGTLCSTTPGMKPFFEEAERLNIDIYLTGAESGPAYDSVKLWENNNITVLKPASPIAMYIKLWMSINEADTKKIMRTSIGDDLLP